MNTQTRKLYFLDASALTLLVENEAGASYRVHRLLRRSGPVKTTWLCVAETYAVLKRRLIRKTISQDLYHYSIFTLRADIDAGKIEVLTAWLEPGARNVDAGHDVRKFAQRHNLDFSDAIQVFEIQRGAPARRTPVLVTCDSGLASAAAAVGIVVWNPRLMPQP